MPEAILGIKPWGNDLCHQPKSFDWRARGAKPNPLKRLADEPFAAACGVLNQIVAIG